MTNGDAVASPRLHPHPQAPVVSCLAHPSIEGPPPALTRSPPPSVRRSLAPFGTRGYHIGLSVVADRMVFALTELKGNLWLREAAR